MDTRKSTENGVGILRSFRARHAEEAIQHSEGLVTVLRLSNVDLRPAEDALAVAKQLFGAHQFSRALNAARRAEALAISLDERFDGYQKAVNTLQIRVRDLQRLGLHTEELEAALGHAEETMVRGLWENGAFVPNYVEARVVLDRAAEEGRKLLIEANAASNQIFLAELAIEVLADVEGPRSPAAFAGGATRDLERALEETTRELALGHIDVAKRMASELATRAEKLRADYLESAKILRATEDRLTELRGEGIVTEHLEAQLTFARDMLERGIITPALEMTRRLAEEAVALGQAHREAATGLADAEAIYAKLVREGFHSYEADAAIKDARRAVKEGSYGRALEHLQKAHAAFVRRRNAREALAKALEEAQKRVESMEEGQFPLLPDVREVLGRAEREFKQGNYSGSSEDLQIATVLLSRDTRSAPRST